MGDFELLILLFGLLLILSISAQFSRIRNRILKKKLSRKIDFEAYRLKFDDLFYLKSKIINNHKLNSAIRESAEWLRFYKGKDLSHIGLSAEDVVKLFEEEMEYKKCRFSDLHTKITKKIDDLTEDLHREYRKACDDIKWGRNKEGQIELWRYLYYPMLNKKKFVSIQNESLRNSEVDENTKISRFFDFVTAVFVFMVGAGFVVWWTYFMSFWATMLGVALWFLLYIYLASYLFYNIKDKDYFPKWSKWVHP